MSRIKKLEKHLPREEEGGLKYALNNHHHVDVDRALLTVKPTRALPESSPKTLLSEYLCGGGGIFFCIGLLALVMILLIVQIMVWRFFDIDIFPVDDTISNKELSNYTFSSGRFRPTD